MTWPAALTGDSTASFTKVGTEHPLGHEQHQHLWRRLPPALRHGHDHALRQRHAAGAERIHCRGVGKQRQCRPTFLLDNTRTNLGTRLADTQVIHSNAGEFQFSTNTTTATSEIVGSLRGAGMTTVTMTTGGTLNFGDVSNGLVARGSRHVPLPRGQCQHGHGGGDVAIANVKFGNSSDIATNQLIGDGTGAGTATISILPYAVGGITTSDPAATSSPTARRTASAC